MKDVIVYLEGKELYMQVQLSIISCTLSLKKLQT